MQGGAASEGRGLLRVLFVRLDQVPAGADAARLLELRCLMQGAGAAASRRRQ